MIGLVGGLILGVIYYLVATRRDRRREGYVVPSRIYRWVWLLVGGVSIYLLDAIDAGEAPRVHSAYLLGVVLLWPDLLFRLVLRPLGWTRASFALSLLANRTWRLAPETGAVCAALLARLRKADRDRPRAVDGWLQRRRRPRPGRGPLVSTHVLAEALRAELRRDRILVRLLMATLLAMPRKARQRAASQRAQEWLLLDAAERGAWDELWSVRALSREHLQFGTFLLVVGEALGDPDEPRDADAARRLRRRLVGRWLVCGHWWSTRRLLRRAWRAAGETLPRGARLEPSQEAAATATETTDPSPLDRARGLVVSGAPVGETVGAWFEALDSDELAAWLGARCDALELDISDSLERVRASLAAAVSEIAAETNTSVPPGFAESLMESQHETVSRRLDECLELIRRRSAVEPGDDPYEDLDAWCHLLRAFGEAQRLGIPNSVLYYQVLGPVWVWAVRLHDGRRERPLAQAVFTWLYRWAEEVGDEENVRLLWENTWLDA
ncbi:MAG: hypothetical protein AAGC60_04955 [Acidobacteriota bacterium]